MQNIHEGPRVGTPSSAWRFRIDTWDFLSYAAKQPSSVSPGGGTGIHLHREIHRLLQLLEAMEPFWAFPGLQQGDGFTQQDRGRQVQRRL